jgi:hypothetical protein
MAADIRKAAKIGERIGQNQAVGMKLLEMARHLGLEAIGEDQIRRSRMKSSAE